MAVRSDDDSGGFGASHAALYHPGANRARRVHERDAFTRNATFTGAAMPMRATQAS